MPSFSFVWARAVAAAAGAPPNDVVGCARVPVRRTTTTLTSSECTCASHSFAGTFENSPRVTFNGNDIGTSFNFPPLPPSPLLKVSFATVVLGLSRRGDANAGRKAIALYRRMRRDFGFIPDEVEFSDRLILSVDTFLLLFFFSRKFDRREFDCSVSFAIGTCKIIPGTLHSQVDHMDFILDVVTTYEAMDP